MNISSKQFGTLKDGSIAMLYTIEGNNGFSVQITNYGGTITSIKMPDKSGNIEEVTLGFETLKEYEDNRTFFGAAIGRFGNRIAGASFSIDGAKYTLTPNNGPNSLHGGIEGFDRKLWSATPFSKDSAAGITMTCFSADGEEGFPGNMTTTMTYTVNDQNELSIDYKAVSDKTTPINLTNHTFFNLGGITKGNVLNHLATMNCPWYIPVDELSIPVGEIKSVTGSVMDFSTEHSFGERIKDVDGRGYDHCYVLASGEGCKPCADVYEPDSGRRMEVFTDQPGVQLYTGNFLDGSAVGHGVAFEENWGFCLETQKYPDCVNQTQFPSPLVKPGDVYSHKVVYKFSLK